MCQNFAIIRERERERESVCVCVSEREMVREVVNSSQSHGKLGSATATNVN